MRALFLILLIALLPLRGWTGDAMAVEMLGHAQHATKTVAVDAVFAGHTSHFSTENTSPHPAGCMDHDQGVATQHSPDSQDVPTQPNHGNCTACQTCSATPVALQTAVPSLPLTLHSVPRDAGAVFASAEPARGFKPPIS